MMQCARITKKIMFIVNRRQTVLIDSFRRSRQHDDNIIIPTYYYTWVIKEMP